MWLVALLSLMLVLAGAGEATTRYVVASGGTGNCSTGTSSGTPINGLQAGLNCTGPGDTLLLQGTGFTVINDTVHTIPSGTSWSNPVIIASAPGPRVQLSQIAIRNQVIQYVSFENFVVDGGGSYIYTTYCCQALNFDVQSHLRLRDSEIRNANSGQLMSGGQGTDLQFINNYIHGAYPNLDPVTDWGGGCNHQIPCTTGGYCIYFNAHDSLFDGNRFEDCTGHGVHMYWGGCSRCIANNVFRNNTFKHIGFDDAQRNQGTASIIAWRGQNNQFYNNIFHGSNAAVNAWAISDQNLTDVIVHNTFTDLAGVGVLMYPGADQLRVRNNIFYNLTGVPIDTSQQDPGTTLIGCSGAHPQCNFTGNPNFLSPGQENYQIPQNSPACGVGEPLGAPYNLDKNGATRTTWDAGAYACGGTPTPLPAPTNLRKTGSTP